MASDKRNISIDLLEINEGQFYGLPSNPRWIRDARFKALKKSIEDAPEMLDLRELLVYPLKDLSGHEDKYIVIAGNMRFRACSEIGYKEIPCKVLPLETPVQKLREYAIKDNEEFGQNDYEALANEWSTDELQDWGMELNHFESETNDSDSDIQDNDDTDDEIDNDGENVDEDEDFDDEFYQSMFKDVIYATDNDFDIPILLKEQEAGSLELPFTPWGANSRLRKDVATYHFYVDDYRFEKLFKNPVNLVTSGCKAIVEPNCSCHDQTPIAWGIQLIYKKRWLSRYLQDFGIKVYADLNVAQKFVEYNKMGIPKGYNAFFTRGTDGWIASVENDLSVAKEISGLDSPNLIVYGGGKEIQSFCHRNGILYVQDFINAKKD